MFCWQCRSYLLFRSHSVATDCYLVLSVRIPRIHAASLHTFTPLCVLVMPLCRATVVFREVFVDPVDENQPRPKEANVCVCVRVVLWKFRSDKVCAVFNESKKRVVFPNISKGSACWSRGLTTQKHTHIYIYIYAIIYHMIYIFYYKTHTKLPL